MSSHRLRNWVLLAALVLFILALDQGTKWLVRHNLAVGEAWAPIPALSSIFTITHVQNTGVAFGQLSGFGWLFMVVNLAVLAFVLVYYPRVPAEQWPMRLALILILIPIEEAGLQQAYHDRYLTYRKKVKKLVPYLY